MARVRFVHAADLHLDTPFQGIAGPAPHVADLLRDASLAAWDDLVQFTLAHDAAALLLAGDIYDGAQRGVRAQLRVLGGLRTLSQAGVTTFIVHGNHDPLGGWSAIREWPPGVHVFGHEKVETRPLTQGDTAVAAVHGISYGRRDVSENLAARFRPDAGAGVNIGLLHATVGTSTEHAAYAPCSLSDLRSAGMDYWALGHIHRREVVAGPNPWIVYPGNLQGRSPKPAETGAKGTYLVEIDTATGAVLPPEFHALDRVRFVSSAYDVSACTDIGGLQEGLGAVLDQLRGDHAGRSLLVRLTLEGRGPVVHDLRRPAALSELRDELHRALASASPIVWLESLVDRAAPALDVEAVRARGEFSAEVLALADRLAADPDELAAFVRTHAAGLAAGSTGRQVRDLPADDDDAVLREALAGVLDRLETTEPA
jgi:DNA repair exonuclease SbcCD nuclease subunit